MLEVWGRRNSLNVQKVMWLVGELELPHTHIPAGGDFGGLDRPQFLSMNPNGRVPVIRDGEVAVWESHAILRYLAEAYARPLLWPRLEVRARIEPWMDWEQTRFQPHFSDGLFWKFYRTPQSQRDEAQIEMHRLACCEALAIVERVLADQPFLAGEQFSLADIPLGTCMFRYFTLDLPRPNLPNVERWYERLQRRKAYATHVMLPYGDLLERQAF